MQQAAKNYLLEKGKEILEEEYYLNMETERLVCASESNNMDNVSEKLPTEDLPDSTGNIEPSDPTLWSRGSRTSPQRHTENQGNLLHFDRQALGRISTSPTLRRLRGSGCGTLNSTSQQDSWGSWKEPARSACHLSKSPPGSLKASSSSPSPLRLGDLRLPSDAETAFNTAGSVELHISPSVQQIPPMLQSINEGSLHQASPPSSLTSPQPSPQVTLIQHHGKQNGS
ncbi:PREDICTED: uncharacterized protein C12orf74 homolog [Elephantulus edwardii]|uniref:uncharacterized protein C12orf74 homolog n=1 Tax=Elephantulus edwardii TaxID=28737 RepID=UPI0003F07AAF|nr:PREDICTED: uncharacterized protein C12orf74 homolog [Elephantulus edwardii]